MMKNRSELSSRLHGIKKVVVKAVTSVTAFFISVIVLSTFSLSCLAQQGVSLEQRIRHLEELSQTRNKVQADLSYQLSELQREIRSLTGQVEDNSFKLKQIQERQRDLYRDIENRLSTLNSGSTGSSRSASSGAGSAVSSSTNPKRTTPTTANATRSVPSGATGGVRREFESAFALVRNKNYAAAISAFSTFLNKYPNNSYSANAHYWMGQVYLVQNNTLDAADQFSTLISGFPSSNKIDASKLKLADIYAKQGKRAEAKALYTQVAKNGSATQQQLARKGLEKTKQAK